MTKKIKKQKDGLTLEIDQEIVEALGINKKTDVEMIVVNDMLIVKSKGKKDRDIKQKKNDLTKQLMDEYEPVLKKLAKT